MTERIMEQCRRFNAGVRGGDWSAYLDAFATDAVLRIDGDPGSPYAGKPAIAAAYASDPPNDTITVREVEAAGDVDTVRFDWDSGGGGTLTTRWSGGLIVDMTVAFRPA